MVRLLSGVAAITASLSLLVGGAAAGASDPRFYAPTPKPGLVSLERHIDRTGAFTDADCWPYDGNRRIGWRHIGCVGNYNDSGTTYRFKIVYTPRSCSRVGEVITVSDGSTARKTVAWHQRRHGFSCRQ